MSDASLPESEDNIKACVECKHLLGKRGSPEFVDRWRCHHPFNILRSGRNNVTGEPFTTYLEDAIGTVRNTPEKWNIDKTRSKTLCNGTWWEEYIYIPPPQTTIGGMEPAEAFSPEALNANRELAQKKLAEAKAKKAVSKGDIGDL